MTPLLTCATVAEQLGVSRSTILRWVGAGVLPGFRLPGGQLRFRDEDLREWIGQRSTSEGGSHLAEAPPAR